MKNSTKTYGLIAVLLIGFTVLRFLLNHYFQGIGWDEAVYIAIGKFIYSQGQVGFLEIVRPIGVPLLVGALWFSGIDALLASRLIAAAFHLIVIVLTYSIAEKLYTKKAGIIAAVFVSANALILLWSSHGNNEIPSAALLLLVIYLLIVRNYTLSGIAAGFAFITRFPIAFALIPIGVYLIIKDIQIVRVAKNLKLIKSHFFIMPAAAVLIGFFAFNQYYFGNIIAPIIQGLQSGGWAGSQFIFKKDMFLYLKTLIYFINVAIPLYFIGLAKTRKNKALIFFCLVLPVLGLLLFHQIFGLKEARYILPIFPLVAIVAGFGATRLKKLGTLLTTIIFVVLSLMVLFQIAPLFIGDVRAELYLPHEQSGLVHDCSYDVPIASSHPISALKWDKTYFYYGAWADEYIKSKSPNIKCFMFASCDFAGKIPPDFLLDQLEQIYSAETPFCELTVFQNKNYVGSNNEPIIDVWDLPQD